MDNFYFINKELGDGYVLVKMQYGEWKSSTLCIYSMPKIANIIENKIKLYENLKEFALFKLFHFDYVYINKWIISYFYICKKRDITYAITFNKHYYLLKYSKNHPYENNIIVKSSNLTNIANYSDENVNMADYFDFNEDIKIALKN